MRVGVGLGGLLQQLHWWMEWTAALQRTWRERKNWLMYRGSLVAGELHETATSGVEDIATVVDETIADATAGADKAEASACLALFLAAALVCQPHEHEVGLPALKNDPRWHRLIAAITANTSLLEGFWPLPANTGFPSARSISCSEYWPTP